MAAQLLAGKVAVVTGGGRAIGREQAVLLASAEARVVVSDLDQALAMAVVEEIRAAGGEAVAHYGDVSEPDGADSLIALALQTWGRLDIAVNNTGIVHDRSVLDMPVEDWDAVMKAHLRGPFLVTRAVCRHFRARYITGSAGGRIINTTSPSGQENYSVATAGIAAFTEAVALEMMDHEVTCNAIVPGASAALDPATVAPLTLFLAGDDAAFITGQVFGIRRGALELFEGRRSASRIIGEESWTVSKVAGAMPLLFAGREANRLDSDVWFDEVPAEARPRGR